jgi:hypothetical protein
MPLYHALTLDETFDPFSHIVCAIVGGCEDGNRRCLDQLAVGEPHIAVSGYQEPFMSVAEFDDARVFYTLLQALPRRVSEMVAQPLDAYITGAS